MNHIGEPASLIKRKKRKKKVTSRGLCLLGYKVRWLFPPCLPSLSFLFDPEDVDSVFLPLSPPARYSIIGDEIVLCI
jgi:hypothetical protein